MFDLINPYAASEVTISLKRESRSSLLEKKRIAYLDAGLAAAAYERRGAIREVNRALNAWHYQERIPSMARCEGDP